jgi:hypothetical protein
METKLYIFLTLTVERKLAPATSSPWRDVMKGRIPVTVLGIEYQLSTLQAFMIMAVEIELGEECWILYIGKL